MIFSDGGATTIYANKYYNTSDGNATKHIFANGLEVAAITGTNSEAIVHYTATDHLTGSSLTTNSSNAKEELLDYLPFGTIKIDQKAGDYTDQRKFAGHEFDNDTGLSYMNARYYDGNTGRFLSEDPSFLVIGDNKKIQEITKKDQRELLINPQNLNSYSYVDNNPIANIDPDGNTTIGICGNGDAGVPGIYSTCSTCGVITFSSHPFNIEFGVIGSGEGGGSTAVGSASANGSFMYSNAKNMKDLEGVDVGGGVALKAGVEVGIDVKTSKSAINNKQISTANVSLGAGGAVTPYGAPVEVRGGASYSKILWSNNITQYTKNSYNYIKNKVNQISTKISSFISQPKNNSQKQNKNKH